MYPLSPMETAPAWIVCPPAAMSRSKLNLGSLPAPWLANGPASLKATGPVSVGSPWAWKPSETSSWPDLTALPPLKVSLSSVAVLASPPFELPQPAASAGSTRSSRQRRRREGTAARAYRSPHRMGVGGSADHPLHRQGRRRENLGRCGDRSPLRGRRPADRRALDRSRALAGGHARHAAQRRAHADRRQPLGPAGLGAGRDGAQLGRRPGLAEPAARRARRR